ncbi:MAG TPA: peptide ABC transporter substrate-binding protein [Candidatus Dormibacteraeota bacterium]|nr:peptide ABC transporter substrate-binding protein [Candidatus Dormibacteraeota bacterium]
MTPTSFRFLKALCVGGAASLALASCTGSSGTTSPGLAADQTLKFPILGDFGTLDPSEISAETDSEIGQNVFNGLIRLDSNLNIVPDIAAMPTVSTDGLTYTFAMRHDVTFSNGDKVTSKDVLYSWNRAAAMQGANARNLSAIAGYGTVSHNQVAGASLEALLEKNDPSVSLSGLSAPDAYTVKVQLSNPAGWFLSAIAIGATTGMVVDQAVVKTDFDNWWTKPEKLIGTGAFKMTARTPNQSVDFRAVPNWWGSPKPTLTKVHLDIIQNASIAITAYEQGTYDIYGYGGYSNAPLDDLRRIQGTANEKAQLLLHPKMQTIWVSFNMVSDSRRPAQGPFTLDQGQSAHDLRLAFALAIDKTKLASVVCHNLICSPATGGLITKGLVGYLGDGADPLAAFDAAKARSLLSGADPTGSKTKGLTYAYDSSTPLNKDVAVFIQDQWQTNLGVHVDVHPYDLSPFNNARLKGAYVLSRDGWQADYNHPQDWFDNLWGKLVGCPDAYCASGYDTAAYDTLLAKADSESLGTGLADYKALSRQLINDVAYIPLYYPDGAFLIKPYVMGAGTNNFFDYYWDQIQILSH